MLSTSTTCSILLKTWAREMFSDFSWYWIFVWCRSLCERIRRSLQFLLQAKQAQNIRTCTLSFVSTAQKHLARASCDFENSSYLLQSKPTTWRFLYTTAICFGEISADAQQIWNICISSQTLVLKLTFIYVFPVKISPISPLGWLLENSCWKTVSLPWC